MVHVWHSCGGLGACFLLAAAAACAHTPRAVPAPASTASVPVAEQLPPATEMAPADLKHHMQASFFLAVDARDSLVDGDLEAARRSAKVLATQNLDDRFPDGWRPFVARMKQHADEVNLAPDLARGGRAIGMLGKTCGSCHWHAQRGPGEVRQPPLPWQDPPEDLGARMFRHDVGVDQLWTGLVTPSEEAWRNGTTTLTRAPLEAPKVDGEAIDDDQHTAVEAIRQLAKQARAARTHDARAETYGELIAACAACHQVTARR